MAPSQDTFKILFSIRFICDADDQSNVKIESASILYIHSAYSVSFVGIIRFATCIHITHIRTYFIFIYRKMLDNLLLVVRVYLVCVLPTYIIREAVVEIGRTTHMDKTIWLSVIIQIKLFSCFSRYRTTHFTLK